MGWGPLEGEDLGSWLQDQQHFQCLGVWVGSGEQDELRHARWELWVASQGAVRCQWLDPGSGCRELMSGSRQRGNKRRSLGIAEGPLSPTCSMGIAEGPPCPCAPWGLQRVLCIPRAPRGLQRVLRVPRAPWGLQRVLRVPRALHSEELGASWTWEGCGKSWIPGWLVGSVCGGRVVALAWGHQEPRGGGCGWRACKRRIGLGRHQIRKVGTGMGNAQMLSIGELWY